MAKRVPQKIADLIRTLAQRGALDIEAYELIRAQGIQVTSIQVRDVYRWCVQKGYASPEQLLSDRKSKTGRGKTVQLGSSEYRFTDGGGSHSMPSALAPIADAIRQTGRAAQGYRGMSLEEVERIASDPATSKGWLQDCGYYRFGIAKSVTSRSREAARFAVACAIENERTLDVISRMAREAGKRRRS